KKDDAKSCLRRRNPKRLQRNRSHRRRNRKKGKCRMLRSHRRCRIKRKKGKCRITIQFPKQIVSKLLERKGNRIPPWRPLRRRRRS
ncbi:hypothetical protein LINPERHAP1_LOCUS23842, partial [Linum perenne]